ncbi:Gfo/Idh/MocA family protein [Lacticaseibacillus daqingensis]|uniref:Gfo/Idh/MocA family protein n=1 Tax=Lacticaseibacillus daqingensis TaxID=2486014 RepID=UPI000F7B6E22|nr:Gfo/Idh/MocA family oxidoreductase [Lacticaseibacillus daqingensis]
MKLGIIGTNWITEQFIAAATATGQYTLAAVYSRHLETAQAFVAKVGSAAVFTDMAAFLASDLDVVYIASPNGLHASQTAAAVTAGKHVIVEKPMVTHPSQLAMIEAAKAAHPDVLVFEAARHLYDPNFAVVQDFAATHTLSGATLVYAKYSSRYDDYLAGKDPNIFAPRFGGGALMDLGVYLVYAAVAWFGVPTRAVYLPHVLASGVDGDGVARLSYPDFDVTLIAGKTFNSELASEIYTGRETLTFDSPGELNRVTLVGPQPRDLTQAKDANPMADEARVFAQAIQTGDQALAAKQWALAKQVHTVMGQLRAGTDIRFGNDPE